MSKRLRLVDKKISKVIEFLAMTSSDITGWAEDSADCIEKINTTTMQINQALSEEKMTQEDAAVQLDKEVGKLFGKLQNRIKRMGKNTKAMTNMINAIKALQDDKE